MEVKKLLQAINLISYDYEIEDKILVKVEYLLILKRTIEKLNEEIEILKKENKLQKQKINELTSELIKLTGSYESLDMYIKA